MLSDRILLTGGTFNAALITTVNGGQIRLNGGAYTATGETRLQDGSIRLDAGTFNAQGNTIVSGGFMNILAGNYNGGNDPGDTTTITGGQLSLNGGTYTATGLTRVNGGILRVNTGTYNAQAVQVSSSVLLLTGGIFNAALGTTINGGELRVTGGTYNATGTVTVSGTGLLDVGVAGTFNAPASVQVTGGRVQGTGTLNTPTLNNTGGTVGPGASIGTLTVTGNYSQGPGGNLEVEVQPGGPADLLDVMGTVTLAGNVEIRTLAANFTVGEQYRIIRSPGPIASIFTSGSLTGAGLNGVAVWVGRVNDAGVPDINGNNVDIIFLSAPGNQPGTTPNQKAVAAALGNMLGSGGVFVEDSMVFSLAQAMGVGPHAYDQIGGEVYDSITAFAFDTGRQFGLLIDKRARTVRCEGTAGRSNPFCGKGFALLADAASSATPDIVSDSPSGADADRRRHGWSLWASALASHLNKSQTSTNLGYYGTTGGLVAGADLALTDRLVVGALFGVSRSKIRFSGVSGDAKLETVAAGLYAAWSAKRWFANGSLVYSWTMMDAERLLQFGTTNSRARGDNNGDQISAHATLGYTAKVQDLAIVFTGGFNWLYLKQQAFTENGAGQYNLSVHERTDRSLRVRGGIQFAYPLHAGADLVLVPSVRVGFARELLDNTRAINASLPAFNSAFAVHGDEGSRNIVIFGAALKAEWRQGLTLFASYDGEWAGDRQVHGGKVGLMVRW